TELLVPKEPPPLQRPQLLSRPLLPTPFHPPLKCPPSRGAVLGHAPPPEQPLHDDVPGEERERRGQSTVRSKKQFAPDTLSPLTLN
ncbi:MAG: hypothetical protein ACLQM8_03840, partial [Limisphaerales bacterium]